MAKDAKSLSAKEVKDLQTRLREAEDTLDAIRSGSIDALVIRSSESQQIFTLKSADYAYRMLIESMDQGALIVTADGVILYSNNQFSTLLNVPLKAIIGARIQDFVVEKNKKPTALLLKNGQSHKTGVELKLLMSDSTEVSALVSVTPMLSEVDSTNICMVVTDMTELNQAQEVKDEFISLASHQLRTPATGVKQYIHLVLDGYFGVVNKDQVKALQKANDANERELEIISELLKVAQIDAGKVTPDKQSTNLNVLLQNIINEQAARTRDSRQTISLIAAKTDVQADIDPVLMQMAIENIVDNACKYTPEGKKIDVLLGVSSKQVRIAVKDQGVGIAEEDIAKLFRKFSRIPNSLSMKVGGNGLGLYWVKKVVELHDGKINVSSVEGHGTVFEVLLPR